LENGTKNKENTNQKRPAWQTSRRFKGLFLENGLKLILISDPHAVSGTGSLQIAAGKTGGNKTGKNKKGQNCDPNIYNY
jgi:secreted Zn-dependent insulinase-like peptidase